MDVYLTTREVANRLRVCVPTVLRLVKAGRLPAMKYLTKDYRFREADVLAFERGKDDDVLGVPVKEPPVTPVPIAKTLGVPVEELAK